MVINETPGSTVPLTDTARTLQRFAAPVPIVMLPRSPGNEAFAEITALL
jgi:hypothetical protein